MTNDIIIRALAADTLEVRESPEGRRICGIAAPFNQDYDAGDYVERFTQGEIGRAHV